MTKRAIMIGAMAFALSSIPGPAAASANCPSYLAQAGTPSLILFFVQLLGGKIVGQSETCPSAGGV